MFDIDLLDAFGRVLVVPLAPSRSGRHDKCRPIGCYPASAVLAARYLEDR